MNPWLLIIVGGIAASFGTILMGYGWYKLPRDNTKLETLIRESTNPSSPNKATILDQRAWLGIERMIPDPAIPQVGQPLYVLIDIRNTGKTPAKNISIVSISEGISKGQKPNFTYTNDRHPEVAVIAPSGAVHLKWAVTTSKSTGMPGPITPQLMEEIKSEKVRLYVHGRMDYQDIFGNSHWIKFCTFLIVPFSERFGFCEEHNGSDDNHAEKK